MIEDSIGSTAKFQVVEDRSGNIHLSMLDQDNHILQKYHLTVDQLNNVDPEFRQAIESSLSPAGENN